MTTRRSFFRSLTIATGMLYLRLAPTSVKAVVDLGLAPAKHFASFVWVSRHTELFRGREYVRESVWHFVPEKAEPNTSV